MITSTIRLKSLRRPVKREEPRNTATTRSLASPVAERIQVQPELKANGHQSDQSRSLLEKQEDDDWGGSSTQDVLTLTQALSQMELEEEEEQEEVFKKNPTLVARGFRLTKFFIATSS